MPSQSGRPMIGIPCSNFPDSWYSPATGNTITYLRAVEAAGGIPLLIHLTTDQDALDEYYRYCDGVLLAGGDDVDPAAYGAERHPHLGVTNPLQDTVEISLTKRALADGKPVFGICRGLQLLNVALGGTLYQDIPSDLPDARYHVPLPSAKRMDALAHQIRLSSDSWLAARLDADGMAVNSIHHQAIRDVAPGLRAVGWAGDDVIEAVEGTGPTFAAAVQCHPEELWERVDRRWLAVFRGYLDEVRRAMA